MQKFSVSGNSYIMLISCNKGTKTCGYKKTRAIKKP